MCYIACVLFGLLQGVAVLGGGPQNRAERPVWGGPMLIRSVDKRVFRACLRFSFAAFDYETSRTMARMGWLCSCQLSGC